ncbi:hypothetical protein Arub01_57420 [Actinomadura rubrobrunea]|uniref:Uncharacterized protein n=1 Tax=Actinomadura rubrobrunea TaxID=115335 RepID=A0A9W6Q017_9ACTN|nr:hypothetical protein [Actinomadura rubrobrunea]GLW67499.1 hypothetical protein Arub01_57420 [Actinomadura rubrobrunea]
MRLLLILAALALFAVIGWLLWYGVTGGRSRTAAPARWETHTESGGGVTVVVVRRVSGSGDRITELGRQVVAEIPDGVPDWEARYHEAMAQARSRVAALEIESQ